MTQEDKKLLFKDLCARLDTNLVCSIYRIDDYGVGYRDEILHGYCKGDIWYEFYFGEDCGIGIDNVSKIKPYLFPLSSMTKDQREELYKIGWYLDGDKIYSCFRNYDDENYKTHTDCFELINWCYENHFDINGLIPRGLAEDATDKNIY
jgi:hypothetical protein